MQAFSSAVRFASPATPYRTQPSMTSAQASSRQRIVVGRSGTGQPRSYRLVPATSRAAAYRRLAISILQLDITTLNAELQAAKRAR